MVASLSGSPRRSLEAPKKVHPEVRLVSTSLFKQAASLSLLMELGTASKKRKICHDEGDHQEEDDEQKMEKFYDLIKNIRKARESLMMNGSKALNGIEENKMPIKKQKQIKEAEKKFAAWKPSFEREDFMEDQAALHKYNKVVVPSADHVTMSFVGSAQREELGGDHQKENTDHHKEGQLELELRLSL